jgi:hypothetical protein
MGLIRLGTVQEVFGIPSLPHRAAAATPSSPTPRRTTIRLGPLEGVFGEQSIPSATSGLAPPEKAPSAPPGLFSPLRNAVVNFGQEATGIRDPSASPPIPRPTPPVAQAPSPPVMPDFGYFAPTPFQGTPPSFQPPPPAADPIAYGGVGRAAHSRAMPPQSPSYDPPFIPSSLRDAVVSTWQEVKGIRPPAANPVAYGGAGHVAHIASMPLTEEGKDKAKLNKYWDERAAAARRFDDLFPGIAKVTERINTLRAEQGDDPYKWNVDENSEEFKDFDDDLLNRLTGYWKNGRPENYYGQFGETPELKPGEVYGPLLIAPDRPADLMTGSDGDFHVVATYGDSDEPLEKTKYTAAEIDKLNAPEKMSEKDRKEILFGQNMAGTLDSVRRGAHLGERADWLLERIPFAEPVREIPRLVAVVQAADTLKDKWEKTGEFDHDAAEIIARFIDRNERKAKANELKGPIRKTWDLVTRLPGTMVEFATTGGPAARIVQSGKRLVGKYAEKSVAGNVAGKVAGAVTPSVVQAGLNVPRLVQRTAENMAPTIDENGQLVEGDGFGRAATRALVDQSIDNLTERMGGKLVGKVVGGAGMGVGAAARKLLGDKAVDTAKAAVAKWTGAQKLNALRKTVANYLEQKYPNFKPGGWYKALADKTQFHGGVGEWLEERYGEGMRKIADKFFDLNLSNPDGVLNNLGSAAEHAMKGEDAEAKQKLGKSIEDSLIEMAAFSIPGAAARGLNALANRGKLPDAAKAVPEQRARDLKTPAGVAQFAAENPDTAREIVEMSGLVDPEGKSRLTRGALGRLTGTSRHAWSKGGTRAQFIGGLAAALDAQQQQQPPSTQAGGTTPRTKSPSTPLPTVPVVDARPLDTTNTASETPPAAQFADGGYATLKNGSRVKFGQGAVAENGDIRVPGKGGRRSRAIPIASITRLESPDRRQSWRRPPQGTVPRTAETGAVAGTATATTTDGVAPPPGIPARSSPPVPSPTSDMRLAATTDERREAARAHIANAKAELRRLNGGKGSKHARAAALRRLTEAQAELRRLNAGLGLRPESENGGSAEQSTGTRVPDAVAGLLMGGTGPAGSGPSPAGGGRPPLSKQPPPGGPPVGARVQVRSKYGKDFGEGTIAGYDSRGRAVFEKPLKHNVRRVTLSAATLTSIIQSSSTSSSPQPGVLVAQPADLPGLPRIGTKWYLKGEKSGTNAGGIRVAGYDAQGRMVFDNPLPDGRTKLPVRASHPTPGPGGAWPDNVLPSIEAMELSTGVELKMLAGPQTPAQQDASKFADSLGVRVLFARFPRNMGFNGFAVDGRIVVLDANQSGIDLTWYLAGHEIAHGTGFDTSIQIDDATAEKWKSDYFDNHLAPNSDYWTYLDDNPQYHRREAVAHMVGWFMQNPQFRRKLEIFDRSLWRRLAQVILNFFHKYELPREGKKVLDAIKARQNEVRLQAAQGTGKPASDPSDPDDGAFQPGVVPGSPRMSSGEPQLRSGGS